jgi:hypothetical protein
MPLCPKFFTPFGFIVCRALEFWSPSSNELIAEAVVVLLVVSACRLSLFFSSYLVEELRLLSAFAA